MVKTILFPYYERRFSRKQRSDNAKVARPSPIPNLSPSQLEKQNFIKFIGEPLKLTGTSSVCEPQPKPNQAEKSKTVAKANKQKSQAVKYSITSQVKKSPDMACSSPGRKSSNSQNEMSEYDGGGYATELRDNFVLSDNLGRGSFGLVRLCISKDTEKEYAVKIVSKRALQKKAGFSRRFPRNNGPVS